MSVSRLLTHIRSYRRYRKTIAQLSKLSDRQLRDIGLARGEIAERARA